MVLGGISIVSSSLVYSADPKVSFYGLIDVYSAAVKTENNGSNKSNYVVNSSGFTTSFIGAKTKIPLSGNLTGVAVVESFLRPDVGKLGRFDADNLFTRNAFIGLNGNFGSISMGRITTLYFISTIITNPFGGSFGFGPSIKNSFLGGLQGDSGWNNAVKYSTPSMGGVKASVLYSAGEVASEAGVNKMNANIVYGKGKFKGTASIQKLDAQADDPTAAKDDNQLAAMAGASYNLGVATISGQFFMMKTETAGVDTDHKTAQIGAAIPVGKAKVLASVAHTKMDAVTDTDRTTAALSYDYFISKKVDVYTVLYMDDADSSKNYTAGVGGRVRF